MDDVSLPYGLSGREDEQRAVCLIRAWANRRLSDREIASRMNGLGLAPPTGIEWTEPKVRKIITSRKLDGFYEKVVDLPAHRRSGPPAYGLRGVEGEIDVVRRIYREAATGARQASAWKPLSMSRIAARLNDNEIPSPRGGRWCRAQVGQILHSDRYKRQVGAILVNKARLGLKARNKRKNVQGKGRVGDRRAPGEVGR